MHPVFKKLGLPSEVLTFFKLAKPVFYYCEDVEHFDEAYHLVPTTVNLWKFGGDIITEVIICHSAMEAIAYLSINKHNYPNFDNLLFLAIGNFPHPVQFKSISKNPAKRKITLVFGRDILGRLCDIKIAAGIKNQPISFRLVKSQIYLRFKGKQFVFAQEEITLSAFEKLSGLRSNCRTRKPKYHNTFLDQLKSYGNP